MKIYKTFGILFIAVLISFSASCTQYTVDEVINHFEIYDDAASIPVEEINKYLSACKAINEKDPMGGKLVIWAALNNAVPVMAELLNQGMDVNQKDIFFDTTVMYAGKSVNPIDIALTKGYTEMTELLIKSSAIIDDPQIFYQLEKTGKIELIGKTLTGLIEIDNFPLIFEILPNITTPLESLLPPGLSVLILEKCQNHGYNYGKILSTLDESYIAKIVKLSSNLSSDNDFMDYLLSKKNAGKLLSQLTEKDIPNSTGYNSGNLKRLLKTLLENKLFDLFEYILKTAGSAPRYYNPVQADHKELFFLFEYSEKVYNDFLNKGFGEKKIFTIDPTMTGEILEKELSFILPGETVGLDIRHLESLPEYHRNLIRTIMEENKTIILTDSNKSEVLTTPAIQSLAELIEWADGIKKKKPNSQYRLQYYDIAPNLITYGLQADTGSMIEKLLARAPHLIEKHDIIHALVKGGKVNTAITYIKTGAFTGLLSLSHAAVNTIITILIQNKDFDTALDIIIKRYQGDKQLVLDATLASELRTSARDFYQKLRTKALIQNVSINIADYINRRDFYGSLDTLEEQINTMSPGDSVTSDSNFFYRVWQSRKSIIENMAAYEIKIIVKRSNVHYDYEILTRLPEKIVDSIQFLEQRDGKLQKAVFYTESAQELLELGISSNNPVLLRKAVEMGADPNTMIRGHYMTNDEFYPLKSAIKSGDKEVVEYLFAMGAKLYPGSMIDAAGTGSLDIGRLLLTKGADINYLLRSGSGDGAVAEGTHTYPIFEAFHKKHYNFVRWLIENDADLDVTYEYMLTEPTSDGGVYTEHTKYTARELFERDNFDYSQ